MKRILILGIVGATGLAVAGWGSVGMDDEYFAAENGEPEGNIQRCYLPGCPGQPVLPSQYSCLSGQECCGLFSCQGSLKPGTGFSCCGEGSTCQDNVDPETGEVESRTCEAED